MSIGNQACSGFAGDYDAGMTAQEASDSWYFAIGDARFGPISGNALLNKISSGELLPSVLIWQEGMIGWSLANEESRFGGVPNAATVDTESITEHRAEPIRSTDNGLFADLSRHAGEVYNKGDAKAGFKFVQEVLGIASVFIFLAGIEAFFTQGRSSFALNRLMVTLFQAYTKCNEDQRRQVRACISVARGGFGIFNKFQGG